MIKIIRRYYFNFSIGVALVTLLVIFYTHTRKEYDFELGVWVQKITSPFFFTIHDTSAWIKLKYSAYVALSAAQVENQALKGEIARLKAEILGYQEQLVDLPKLKQAFQFENLHPGGRIYALVDAEIESDYSQLMLINRGYKDGIVKNQGVVSYEGIVGKITRVTETSALIQMVTDVQSKVPVALERSHTRALLEGDGKGGLFLRLLPREEQLKVGDKVITSGITSIFPSGYTVGTVAEVYKKEFGWFQEARVKPAVALDKIEDVFVLKDTGKKELLDSIK